MTASSTALVVVTPGSSSGMNSAGKSVVDSIVNSALPMTYCGTQGMYQLSGSGSAST